jgi:hypothetical protein
MEKRYIVDVFCKHREIVWAEDKKEATAKAQERVFEDRINHEVGDLITGYQFIRRIK